MRRHRDRGSLIGPRWWVLALVAGPLGLACGGTDSGNADGGRPGALPDARIVRDAGVEVDACRPRSCSEAGVVCGRADDGCGGTLDCGPCCVDPAECPGRPCEVAVGCEGGACRYEPVSCGGSSCTCTDGECGDDDLRACGDGCADAYCDPSPVLDPATGDVTYGNACVARSDVRCGLCGLGTLACQDGADVCGGGLDLVDVDPAFVECAGDSPAATVVYLDPEWTGGESDGSREAPFTEWEDAVSAAAARGSRAVVIAGSPTLLGPFEVSDGLSIVGGYGRDWRPDPDARPRLLTGPAQVRGGMVLAGLVARGVVANTRLVHLEVGTYTMRSTARTGPGRSNVGVLAVDSPGLQLRDVWITVGGAEHGAPGAAAEPPSSEVYDGGDGPAETYVARTCSGRLVETGGAGARPSVCDGVEIDATAGGDGADQNEAANSAEQGYTAGSDADAGTPGGSVQLDDGDDCLEGAGASATAPAGRAADGAPGVTGITWFREVPVATGRGARGETGAAGAGGGGGSSGRSREELNSNVWGCRVGGGGGGGGGGGCGGRGGYGGEPGGWVVGLAVAGPPPRLESVEVRLGRFGRGGRGGFGSAGTRGGRGGAGGASDNPSCVWDGRPGGDGAPGQDGGDGGRGADGGRVGVLCRDAAGDLLDLSTVTVETVWGGEAPQQMGCL